MPLIAIDSQPQETTGGSPVATDTQPQGTTVTYPAAGHVTLYTPNGSISVTAKLRGPVADPLPRPRVVTTERPGRASTTEWVGRDPYETIIPIAFDTWAQGESVEQKISTLEQLALRARNASEPPIVRIEGMVPDRVRRQQWRIADIRPVDGRQTLYTVTADRKRDLGRSRFVADVYLIERVVDDILGDSLQAGEPAGGGHARTTKARRGEKLRDVARRIYHDSSRALDIARANPVNGEPRKLGAVLPTGLKLKLP